MKRKIIFVIVVAILGSAGAFLVANLQQRSRQIAALKHEIVVIQEQQNAGRMLQLLKTEDLRNLQITPVGDYLTPLESERRSRRTRRE